MTTKVVLHNVQKRSELPLKKSTTKNLKQE